MKQITSVEMASDSQIYEIKTGGVIEIIPDGEGFTVTVGGEEINFYHTRKQAEADLAGYQIDDHLVIKGFGIHAGRKFWQLPEWLKKEILAYGK